MNQEIVTNIRNIAREHGLPTEGVFEALERSLAVAEQRAGGTGGEVAVRVDRDTGEVVVLDRDPEGGVRERPASVGGRAAAHAVRGVIADAIRDQERDALRREYADRIGELVIGIVAGDGPGPILVDLGRGQAILPVAHQVPGERHRRGERLRAVVADVGGEGQEFPVVLSRRSPRLVAELLRHEVPEVEAGLVEVRGVAREPGVRAKVAVAATRPGVDPVGACIGPRGARVRQVQADLGGERVDVLRHEEDPARLLARALAPAHVREVLVDDEARRATVVVPDDEVAAAIGRAGVNARLAARLVGWRVDVTAASDADAGAGAARGGADADDDGRCAAVLASGRRCVNAAVGGTRYCALPGHAALAAEAA